MRFKERLARYGANVENNAELKKYATQRANSEAAGNRPAGSEMPEHIKYTTETYLQAVDREAERALQSSQDYGVETRQYKGNKSNLIAKPDSTHREVAERIIDIDANKGLAAVGRRAAVAVAIGGAIAAGIAENTHETAQPASSVSHESHVEQPVIEPGLTSQGVEAPIRELPGASEIPTYFGPKS